MLGTTLTIVIPVVLVGYGVWLAIKLIRNRKNGGGCGSGCAGCPYAGSCHSREDCKLDDSDQKPKPRR